MRGLPPIDIAVMLGYFVLVTIIGLASTKKVSTQGDYYVGGRKFGKFLTIMMAFGVGTSNTHPILVSGAVYKFGMSGIWYSWLYMLFMPVQWILEPLTRRLRIYTTADYFDLRYSKGLGPFFSISAMFNIGIMIGTMLIGLGQIIEGITDGGLTSDVVIPVSALVMILYGTGGGILAAALTDVIQGLLVIVLSFMLLPPMFSAVGGFDGLHAALPAEYFSLAMPARGDPTKDIGLFAIFMLFINGVMGNLVEPQAQTKQSAKNEWTLRLGVQIGSFLKRLCTVGWALVGLCAAVVWPNLADPEQAFGMATRKFMPPGFSGLMIAAMMAAAMSTCSAVMVAGSAIFSRNLYAKYIRTSASDKHYLTVARVVGVLLVCIGVLIAYWQGTVTKAVEFWWTVTAFIGPTLLIGMFWRRGNSWGAWGCMIVSAVVWILTSNDVIVSVADTRWNTVWYQASLYLPAGIGTYILLSLLTPPEEKRKLDRFFARLNTPVGEEAALIATGLEPNPEEILPAANHKRA